VKLQAKQYRIKKRKEIQFLFCYGFRWNCNHFLILYKNNSFKNDRFAVIVSKKNGQAVERNKIKRIIRQIFRENINHTPPFFDILIKPIGKFLVSAQEIQKNYQLWQTMVKK